MTREFKVGDRVKIREWEDMASEYGFSGWYIRCKCAFTPNMKPLCGKEFVITQIKSNGVVNGHNFGRIISVDMIELAEKENEIEADNTKINEFLDQFDVL